MSAEKRFYVIGFYISLAIYAAIFITLAYMYGKSPDFLQRYTARENFLDIILVERKEATAEEKTQAPTIAVVKPSSPSPTIQTQTTGIRDLFASVDENNLTKIGDKPATPSRLDGKDIPQNNASKLLDKLTFKKQSTIVINSANSGIYDPFVGKIQDMLSQMWTQTAYTVTGASAQVTIMIDNSGSFSYSIVSLSYNNDFNEKLKVFLEDMVGENFPPYEGEGVFKFNTTFKDEME
ncbi:MAG: TonB C-terminal domain-containing protein [Campylobacteraceae bacterium]|jgi:protein TonB|nr:TonB C-terminal domain-containing protein [Campylobacteraceae bacterium]